jgi:uncharacterized protein (DUF3084 family)
MIIFDQITEANRIEHLENLLKVTQITLESVTEQRDEVRADLEFRRGLFQLQEQQLNDVRAERDGLGRDLSAVKEQRDTAQKALFSAVDDYEKAIEQRDRLAEVLNDLWHHYSLTGAAYELIEKALAAVKAWSDE